MIVSLAIGFGQTTSRAISLSPHFERSFKNLLSYRTENDAYSLELAGLRGVAITVVVIGHLLERLPRFYEGNYQAGIFEKDVYAFLATPFSGCCIFFCVSGYTLYEFVIRDRSSLRSKQICVYILKRLTRLYPPYAIVITATFIFIRTTGFRPIGTNNFFGAPDSLELSLISALTLSHDLVFGTFPRLFPPGWFVETQIQFYLVAPFLWQAYSLVAPRRLFPAVVMLLAFSFASLLIFFLSRHLEYSVLEYIPYFWVGALAAMLNRGLNGTRWIGRLARVSPINWLGLVAFFAVGEPASLPSLQLLVRLICLTSILVFAFAEGTTFRAFLRQRWLALLGNLSLSIYLVHLQTLQITISLIMNALGKFPPPVILLGSVLGGASAVLAASIVFYWLVERPCLKISRELFAQQPPPRVLPNGQRTRSLEEDQIVQQR